MTFNLGAFHSAPCTRHAVRILTSAPYTLWISPIPLLWSPITAAMVSYAAQWSGQHAGLGLHPHMWPSLPVTEATQYTGSSGVADIELPNLHPGQCIYYWADQCATSTLYMSLCIIYCIMFMDTALPVQCDGVQQLLVVNGSLQA